MASSAYASALGRLKPEFTAFLSKETYQQLVAAKDSNEVAKILEGTPYGPDVQAARVAYQGIALVEIAINRTFVRRIRHAYEATPFAGRGVVGAYLTRWDIQNIELILSSKAQGRPVTETEEHLISSREIPAGLYAGVLTLDDYPRCSSASPRSRRTANALVRYGYGATVLPLVEAFQRTHDIFPILHALDQRVLPPGARGRAVLPGRRVGRSAVPRERDRRPQRAPSPQGEGGGPPDGRGPLPLVRGRYRPRLPGPRPVRRPGGPRARGPARRALSLDRRGDGRVHECPEPHRLRVRALPRPGDRSSCGASRPTRSPSR